MPVLRKKILLFGKVCGILSLKEKGVASIIRKSRMCFREMEHICVRTVEIPAVWQKQQDFCF